MALRVAGEFIGKFHAEPLRRRERRVVRKLRAAFCASSLLSLLIFCRISTIFIFLKPFNAEKSTNKSNKQPGDYDNIRVKSGDQYPALQTQKKRDSSFSVPPSRFNRAEHRFTALPDYGCGGHTS
jgi:hypothetical protein